MTYKEAYQLFEDYLKKSNLAGKPKELYEPLEYTMAMGGKRIRPALLLMAGSIFSDDSHKMLDAALGLELFHNFTLVHDDIMDNAPLRRGKKTVHEKWNRDIAILSGDVMFVKACQLISQSSNKNIQVLMDLFYKSAVLVCEGQQLDMNFEEEENVSIVQYLEMIEKKTAVLIACAMEMGANLGGAKPEDAQHLYEFGRNIGIAFQLQDDILDAFAKDGQFGKRIGGDIISGKKTFLLLKSMELADEKTSAEMIKIMQTANEVKKVEKMLSIFEQLEIREKAEQEMQSYFNKGMDHLHKVNAPQPKKQALQTLAMELMNRIS